ncbi:alpha/beta hydrolase [Sinimarinibacterium sp. CAU 1509]|uniref:alpha/beta fold hydrolase n=1 Tax=Sinimarinibacterium sp. CAU 1509 TaxID=2562283 RepID=UPI0010ABFC2C|nr:alpha/beta hydrolase [Sinimarinibacterium sp. CAU 1509]TJY58385.1 alpha/beta hydrolase [Sinimarinibacterium sp. CAU 1509]
MPYLRTRDGARLHYHDIGRGEPVVLLHGFAMPAALWLPFALPLAHRYRFILPDLRGFGGSHSTALSQSCLLSQHADDLADLLDALDLHGVRLGGLSMGACTALQYHRLHGFERIDRYLHIDQSPRVRNDADWQHGLLGTEQQQRMVGWKALMGELEPYRGADYETLPPALRRQLWHSLSEFFDHAFHHRGWKAIGRLARYEQLIRRVAPTQNWSIYLDCVRSYLEDDYDWRPSLPQMKVPMTVLIGEDSVMYPAAGQRTIADLVPHAQMVTFSRCGHAIPFEAPRRFGRELRRFLNA